MTAIRTAIRIKIYRFIRRSSGKARTVHGIVAEVMTMYIKRQEGRTLRG
jgi:hypothetical protein